MKCILRFRPNYPNTTEDTEWRQIITISSNQWVFQRTTEMMSQPKLFQKVKKRFVIPVCPNLRNKSKEDHSPIRRLSLNFSVLVLDALTVVES